MKQTINYTTRNHWKRILCTLLMVYLVQTTAEAQRPDSLTRYIEVTGYSEFEAEPDEIIVAVTIEEFLKEDVDQTTQYRNYHKKEKISDLEQELLKDLRKIGISKEQINVRQTTNLWRNAQYGQDALQNKTYNITLFDFKSTDRLFKSLNTRGISSIVVKDLHTKKLNEYKKRVLEDALKDAQTKAGYILSSAGERKGQIISITEVNNPGNGNDAVDPNGYAIPSSYTSNAIGNKRFIILKSELKVRFKIEGNTASDRQF